MSRIFCPFHAAEGEQVEGTYAGTYDDDDFNSMGTVEMVAFVCSEDPEHAWSHPHPNFWLRWAAYGVDWKARRDKLT